LIPASRFIALSDDRSAWLAARALGITATQVAAAATESGFAQVVAELRYPSPVEDNAYMAFGRDSEAEIMRHAHLEHGILPSHWLIAGEDPRDLATPDGLSLDHTLVAEAKTTGKDWSTPPIKYRRQVMWQLHCTGAERGLLLWNLRVPDERGGFYLGWIEPKTLWIERDPKMINELVATRDRLLSIRSNF